jgi:hypothetical protein
MNDLIKKLAEQASEIDGDDLLYYHPVFAEKLAKLIVRKCADRATWAQDTGEKDIGGEVLKHFGVEE